MYVEKPVSHNVSEGRKIAEAAQKYDRIVQTGTQNRSSSGVKEAMDFLHSGKLGKVYLSRKGLCYKPRGSIGTKADAPVPEGVDYNLWLGPAPEKARSTPTGSTTSGTGTGTTATATSATRASTRWTWPAGA